jgi:hypothetical protein
MVRLAMRSLSADGHILITNAVCPTKPILRGW